MSVWCVPLHCTAGAESRLQALLDPGETARAARFASPDLHMRYVVSHGVLRLILSACTGRDPDAIHIDTSERGKPVVAGGPHFSLSHCDDVALVAVATGGPVGVDVERIRPELHIATFARDLVTDADVRQIESLSPERRERAWFQAWTRLEAVAKAAGDVRTWDLDLGEAHVGTIAAGHWATDVVYA